MTTSNNGHTPGPWTVTHNSWEVSTVYGCDDNVVAECPIDGSVDELTQDHLEGVKEANARLIAACPDLLTELQEARTTISLLSTQIKIEINRGSIRWEGVPRELQERLATIDAAIAKATGEAA